jgi:hypothetical protein
MLPLETIQQRSARPQPWIEPMMMMMMMMMMRRRRRRRKWWWPGVRSKLLTKETYWKRSRSTATHSQLHSSVGMIC